MSLTTMTYRTPNFTLEQKLYLLQRIQGVVETVQDFRKDTNTTVQRNAVWERLALAFNAAFPDRPPSTTGSLKTLWKRLKVECRAALHRRQEQLAAGLPLAALTQVQREVTALVPNLISNQDEWDGEGGAYAPARSGSPITVTGNAGTSGSDQEDADHNQNDELDSKEQVAINLGLATPPELLDCGILPSGPASGLQFRSRSVTSVSSGPRPVLYYANQLGGASHSLTFDPPSQAAARLLPPATAAEDARSEGHAYAADSQWEARRQELAELEHGQTMRVLLLQQRVWEEKRKAVRQKEKAARAKKRYYQAKLQRIGAEVQPSSSDSED